MLHLHESLLSTPLGPMVAIGSESALYVLEFADRPGLQCRIEDLLREAGAMLFTGMTPLLVGLKQELDTYFKDVNTNFTIPLSLLGTPFQLDVWEELKRIPSGQTRSYSAIAHAIGKESASRAVGSACHANRIALLIPCHRVIPADGSHGAYAGGTVRKENLLAHESHYG